MNEHEHNDEDGTYMMRDELPKEDHAQVRYVYGQFAEHAKECETCKSGVECLMVPEKIESIVWCQTGKDLLLAIFN